MSKEINRREFLKIAGLSSAAVAAAACASKVNEIAAPNASTNEPEGEMTYRNSPQGDSVSLLGYGMMRLPMLSGDGSQEINQELVNQEVEYAINHGVNYFDSSPVYVGGKSEQSLGIALKKFDRSKFNVATKLSTFGSPTRNESIQMYNDSFKNLGVDVIDFYLLHGISSIEDYHTRFADNGMVDYLLKEKQNGKIRNLGFSIHANSQTFDYMMEQHDSGKAHWDFVQIQMNFVDWNYATEQSARNTDASYLYAELEKRGIKVVIMEPLLGGRLATINDYFDAEFKEREPQKSIASWAFRFCGSHPGVMTVLSGMTYMEHLIDNVNTFSPLKPLTDEEFEFLEYVAKQYISFQLIPCTGCSYCMPCPYGLDIPAIFRHYNKCINEGKMIDNPDNDEYKSARRAFLIGYDRSVPKLRQAAHCIGCGECVNRCPQHIQIPANMRLIDGYVEKLKQN